MLIKILTMKKSWQLAALVALAAIPLIVLAGKQADNRHYSPEPGDDSDMFEGESSSD